MGAKEARRDVMNKQTLEEFLSLPAEIQRIIREDLETALVNRIKAMKEVFK